MRFFTFNSLLLCSILWFLIVAKDPLPSTPHKGEESLWPLPRPPIIPADLRFVCTSHTVVIVRQWAKQHILLHCYQASITIIFTPAFSQFIACTAVRSILTLEWTPGFDPFSSHYTAVDFFSVSLTLSVEFRRWKHKQLIVFDPLHQLSITSPEEILPNPTESLIAS